MAEFISTSADLGFEGTLTQTCAKELLPFIEGSINEHINTGTLSIIDDTKFWTPSGSDKGENSIIEATIGASISNAWAGTADEKAIKKFTKYSISTIDNFEFLWIMTRKGVISLQKAIQSYQKWQPVPKKYSKEKNFIEFCFKREKQILTKLGVTALL